MNKAFTIIELLIAVVIVVVLMGLLAPSLANVQRAARDATCRTNLHTLGAYVVEYVNEHRQLMPWHEPTLASERASFDLEPSVWVCPERRQSGTPYAYLPGVYMSEGGYSLVPTPQGVMHTRKLYEKHGDDPVFADVGAVHSGMWNSVTLLGEVRSTNR